MLDVKNNSVKCQRVAGAFHPSTEKYIQKFKADLLILTCFLLESEVIIPQSELN